MLVPVFPLTWLIIIAMAINQQTAVAAVAAVVVVVVVVVVVAAVIAVVAVNINKIVK